MQEIPTARAKRPFRAARDEAGVPHVLAPSWSDALYGLGYLHALDRGTQLLFARSVALGRAAEQIADRTELVETDLFFRRIGLHLRLQEEFQELRADWREQISIYCEGVNAGLSDLGRTWPMWATGYNVCPWDEVSVVLIGRLLSFGGLAVSQLENERIILELIHAGVDELTLRELFHPRLDAVSLDWLKQIHLSNRLSNEAMELLSDLPRLAGSNAWAVHGSRSQTGSALLAADPHLEVNRLPAIWYEVTLSWGDGHYVMGASLPGCPLFSVGRTRNLAWGVTHMKGDVIDFFVEDCRKRNGRWQYRRGTRWRNFQVRQETIVRRGRGAEEHTVFCSDMGPLEENPEHRGEGYHLGVRWVGALPGNAAALGTWLELVHARSVKQAMRIAARCAHPALCWILADREGHIGYQAGGRFPKRPYPYHGLTPFPAWQRSMRWNGWMKLRELPQAYDPPEEFVAAANEEICSRSGWPLVTQPAPDYRKRRIVALLSALAGATVQAMQTMQYDVYSIHAEDLLRIFLAELPEGTLKEQLARWDRCFTPQSTEATLFFRLYIAVMIEMLGHARGVGWRRMLYLCSRAGYSLMILTAADRLLQRPDSPWWRRDGLSRSEMIRRAAERIALRPIVPWAQVNSFHFTDRFFGGHRVGRLLGYDSQKYAMPGCHATIFYGHVLQTATRETTFAPSYHFVTDMASDEAWTNLPGGPSENRFSPWYRSDIPRWLTGQYKRLLPEAARQAHSAENAPQGLA